MFVDIKRRSKFVEKTRVQKNKKKIKAIMVTDYGGLPADWKQFKEISQNTIYIYK